MPPRRFITLIPLVSLVLIAGCRDREITAYRAPKDKPEPAMPSTASVDTNALPPGHPAIDSSGPAAPGGDGANTAVPTASGSDLRWTAPAVWTAKSPGQMRKGSYTIKGDGGEADLGITAFPGATGGLEANLNRWRGQVGLPPASPEEIVAVTEKFESNGLQFIVADYAGNGTRLIGAIVPHGGNSWFFKLIGPDAVVAGQKAAFLEFLHTVRTP